MRFLGVDRVQGENNWVVSVLVNDQTRWGEGIWFALQKVCALTKLLQCEVGHQDSSPRRRRISNIEMLSSPLYK
jgi:hypothetical protein